MNHEQVEHQLKSIAEAQMAPAAVLVLFFTDGTCEICAIRKGDITMADVVSGTKKAASSLITMEGTKVGSSAAENN